MEVARRLFEKFDRNGDKSLTRNEIEPLIIETYKNMGMTYTPSKEDIDSWMKMTDTDGDGLVTLIEYEDLILRSL